MAISRDIGTLGLLKHVGSALFWRSRGLIPAPLRRQIRFLLIRLLVPSAGRYAPEGDTRRITVAGLLTSPSGIGEGARLSAAALAELGFHVGLVDVTGRFGLPQGIPMPAPSATMSLGDAGGPLLLHLNPPEIQNALLQRLVSRRGRKLIAYWAWELDTVSAVWREAFRLVHEIWVPTRFVADALRRSGATMPIRVVPHPVSVQRASPSPPRERSSRLRVLTVFAYDSGFDRKNPIAAVEAFRMAFGDRTDVELIVKARGRSRSGEPERRFAAAIGDAANVRILGETFTREQYLDLLASADVVLSLHRSEGFGLVLAEAMLMGKPVVATAWSGNVDFMTAETACLVPATLIPAEDESDAYRTIEAHWADPSVPAAAEWLRRLEDPELRRSIGTAARQFAAASLGAEAFGKRMNEPAATEDFAARRQR